MHFSPHLIQTGLVEGLTTSWIVAHLIRNGRFQAVRITDSTLHTEALNHTHTQCKYELARPYLIWLNVGREGRIFPSADGVKASQKDMHVSSGLQRCSNPTPPPTELSLLRSWSTRDPCLLALSLIETLSLYISLPVTQFYLQCEALVFLFSKTLKPRWRVKYPHLVKPNFFTLFGLLMMLRH